MVWSIALGTTAGEKNFSPFSILGKIKSEMAVFLSSIKWGKL